MVKNPFDTKKPYRDGFAAGWDNPQSDVDNPYELFSKEMVDFEVGFRNGSKARTTLYASEH